MIKTIRQALDQKKYSAEELVKEYFKKETFLESYKESAIEQAKIADQAIKKGSASTLTGIPYAIKDDVFVKGKKCSNNLKILENYIAPFTSPIIEKLNHENAILLGKVDHTSNLFVIGGGFSKTISSFKSTANTFLKKGFLGLTSSLDQIGCFSNNVNDLKIVFSTFEKEDHTSFKIETFENMNLPHLKYANSCYDIIESVETLSSLSRFDGIRYGKREDGDTLDDIYTNTREKGFNDSLKEKIILGSYFLSAKNYNTYFKKALKTRSLIKKDFENAFKKADVFMGSFSSGILKASVNLTGYPALYIQEKDLLIIAKHFHENKLFNTINNLNV